VILSLVTPPAGEPLTTAEAKMHARVVHIEEDPLIADLIAGARELFEQRTGRQVLEATWQFSLDRFPRGRLPIRLPKPPLLTVVAVRYMDTAGVQQAWNPSEYRVVAAGGPYAGPGLLYPKQGYTYPATDSGDPLAVTVEYTAGYAVADVPAAIKDALRLIVADLYLNREAQIIGTIVADNAEVSRLIHAFRVPVFA
jgi:uncharacterized phiE125 gp8 family phage protein